jgi:hypothetical protein
MMAFKKGVTGNANGRPSGKTPATLLRKSIADDMPEIIATLIGLAKKGDVAAAKILMDRVCPSLKPEAMPINLVFQESLAAQGNEIIKAIMSGILAPDIGSALLAALSNQSKIIESDEVLRRLELLENSKGLK